MLRQSRRGLSHLLLFRHAFYHRRPAAADAVIINLVVIFFPPLAQGEARYACSRNRGIMLTVGRGAEG